MTPYYDDGTVALYLGDCLDVLRTLPDASADAVVTDPPAGIAFMGREWDGDRGGRGQWTGWLAQRLAEAARVLRPGAHALVWALPRTSHWTATAIDDAGLEIRDCITHLFGSGFPKHKGALKPAAEHWWLARRPLCGTVAANVAEHGTGALSIDACRIPTSAADAEAMKRANTPGSHRMKAGASPIGTFTRSSPSGALDTTQGRWPTNVVISHLPECGAEDGTPCAEGCAVAELDRQSGPSVSRIGKPRGAAAGDGWGMTKTGAEYADVGGASRFFPVFRYAAKAPAAERPRLPDGTTWPTVKPLALMRWLVRLVTPPGGQLIDPFAGSGATGEAALIEGVRCLLIDSDPQAAELAKTRLARPIAPVLDLEAP
ncbi:DNA-methyltransferase [Actinomadura sp. SCN-SB]|uniref:DNA-methyltransferase n=1 Tax=Actinomadura sp. SCN-SB TaxID=3373092 RepID=UPI003750C37A